MIPRPLRSTRSATSVPLHAALPISRTRQFRVGYRLYDRLRRLPEAGCQPRHPPCRGAARMARLRCGRPPDEGGDGDGAQRRLEGGPALRLCGCLDPPASGISGPDGLIRASRAHHVSDRTMSDDTFARIRAAIGLLLAVLDRKSVV